MVFVFLIGYIPHHVDGIYIVSFELHLAIRFYMHKTSSKTYCIQEKNQMIFRNIKLHESTTKPGNPEIQSI